MSAPFDALRPLLFAAPIAHRGLWASGGAPENSLAAFSAACGRGFGIELDVRLTADGGVVVFHDGGLRRMTGVDGEIAQTSTADLARLRLAGTDEVVPTLQAALSAVGRDALVLVECKTAFGEVGPLEAAVAELLDQHDGPAAVIGFNPLSHAWFAQHRPRLARGLNSYAYNDRGAAGLSETQRAALAAFESAAVTRPDFILPGLDILQTAAVERIRGAGTPVIAWTVRTAEQRTAAAPFADNIIFEGEALA